jgi:hypothetical protein
MRGVRRRADAPPCALDHLIYRVSAAHLTLAQPSARAISVWRGSWH